MTDTDQQQTATQFTAESKQKRLSLPGELWQWMKHNKKWWLLPIIIILLLLSLIVILGTTGLAPFIYPVI